MHSYGSTWTEIILILVGFIAISTALSACIATAYKRMINSKKVEIRRNWSIIFLIALVPTLLFIGIMIGSSF